MDVEFCLPVLWGFRGPLRLVHLVVGYGDLCAGVPHGNIATCAKCYKVVSEMNTTPSAGVRDRP